MISGAGANPLTKTGLGTLNLAPSGVNTYAGKLTYEAVAIDQQREYTPLDEMLGGATTTSATHGT